jgi:hypothetical protein
MVGGGTGAWAGHCQGGDPGAGCIEAQGSQQSSTCQAAAVANLRVKLYFNVV